MRRSVVLAAGVGTVLGVDLDAVALIDEQRDLNLGTGLNGGRLGAGVGTVALQARLGVGDGQDTEPGRSTLSGVPSWKETRQSVPSSKNLALSPTRVFGTMI